MTCSQVLEELEAMGNEQTKRILAKHGVREPFFGVKIEDMKKIQKKVKKDHELSLELFKTGNSDAMYLAGLIADEKKISPEDLRSWAENSSGMVTEYTVPWIAADSGHGFELALEWIDSANEKLQVVGWSTLSSVMSIRQDKDLDLPQLKLLLQRVEKQIHHAANRVRYAMNGFVIAAGCFVSGLTETARKVGKHIGNVTVDMNGTSCKVQSATDYISKVEARGSIGRKKKMARC
jgi:3-methyladenine DNA glycosylase AlkD